MEAHRTTINQCFDVDIRSAVHLTTEAKLGIFLSAEMPDFASRSEAVTSSVLLPIEDTIPIPVTTTRRIAFSFTPDP